MKDYRIEPHRIEELVIATTKAFRIFQTIKSGNPHNYPKYMHFMADLLKDLVETAYPIEEKIEDEEFQGPSFEVITITETTPFSEEQFTMAMKNISKIMKDYKPPKAGEF